MRPFATTKRSVWRSGRDACTGLSVRAWRELIKIGAVRTITEDRGRGHVRLCDATTLKRAAVIAALNRAGFSLAVSGRIAYFLPIDELLYAIWDPCWIFFRAQWKWILILGFLHVLNSRRPIGSTRTSRPRPISRLIG